MAKHLAVMLFASVLLGLISNALQPPISYSSSFAHICHIISYVGIFAVILVLISFSISLIPRSIYWFRKKKRVPDLMVLVWSIWGLLAIAVLASDIYGSYLRSEIRPRLKENISRTTANKIYQKVKNSIYMVFSKDEDGKLLGTGSAVAITSDFLATNCHVIDKGKYFTVTVHKAEKNGFLYSAHGDLCLIGVVNEKFIPVERRFSNEVGIGEDVYTIGNPEGFEKSISKGIISNKYNEKGMIILQTDAAISPGSSGGGLFDHNGKLIGITFLRVRNERLAFVIPTETITAALLEPVVDIPKDEETKNVSASRSSQARETPKVQKSNSAVSSFNKITRISSYGEDEVGLMSWKGSCFITISGRRRLDQPTSLAIWFPRAPNGLFIFSRIVNAEDAVKFLSWMGESENVQYLDSKSYIFFDKNLYPLTLISVNDVWQPVFIFSQKKVITESLITLDEFLVQFYGYNHEPGMTTIWFGLNGFTEALAAYNKYCSENN